MAHGTASRCDVALRPRGRARVALTRGRRPRGRVMQAPMWGATWHVWGGAGRWRAHGSSGTLVTVGGR